jgi:hypothetical protein
MNRDGQDGQDEEEMMNERQLAFHSSFIIAAFLLSCLSCPSCLNLPLIIEPGRALFNYD